MSGMSDTFIIVIGIGIGVVLIFVFPLMSLSDRTNDISQSLIQSATSEFADKISISGQIKPSDYEAYVQTITATGNTFDVEIEVQHLDENPGKKSVAASGDLIGENVRYSTYTTEILSYMYDTGTTQPYPLKKGDIVIIKFKNTNKTPSESYRTTFYGTTGQGASELSGSASSMVVNTGATN